MPYAMRASGTFGTHWRMPVTMILKDPFSSDKQGVELKSDVAKEIIDAMYSKEYAKFCIQKKWPTGIMCETKNPWRALEDAFK
jgi:hypothetical protein